MLPPDQDTKFARTKCSFHSISFSHENWKIPMCVRMSSPFLVDISPSLIDRKIVGPIVRRQSDKNHSQTNWFHSHANLRSENIETNICIYKHNVYYMRWVFAWTGHSEIKQFKSSFFILLFIFHDSPNLKTQWHCARLHSLSNRAM